MSSSRHGKAPGWGEGPAYLRDILERTHEGFWVVDSNRRFLDVNTAYCRMSGYDRASLLSMGLDEIDVAQTALTTAERMVRIRKNGFELFESRHRRSDGSMFDVEVSASWMDGPFESYVGFCRDITDRKLADAALRESRYFNRSLIQSMPLPIFYKNLEGRFVEFNAAFESFMGLDYARLYMKTAFDVAPPELAAMYHEKDSALISSPGTSVYESKIIGGAGALRDVVIHKATILNLAGEPVGIIGAIFDITERNRDEATIRGLLEEKETLLRETHHRIKNNMATVISLLSARGAIREGAPAREALADAGLKIKSMMVLYDKLYRSSGFKSLGLRIYLESLVKEILSVGYSPAPIEAELDIEDIELDAEVLSPLGIAINELLSNSMKHAFDGADSGRVTIRGHISEGFIVLKYADDGPGLPPGADADSGATFGLRLLSLMAQQIGGSIRLDPDDRRTFTLSFPIAPDSR